MRDAARLMRIRSRGKSSGSKIPFHTHGKRQPAFARDFLFYFLKKLVQLNRNKCTSFKSFWQRYEKRRSNTGATVDAVQVPRMCLCLPPLKLSNWICARRGSGWSQWVTAGSTPPFINSHGAKTAAAVEEEVARRSRCGSEESAEESQKFKEGQQFLTGWW